MLDTLLGNIEIIVNNQKIDYKAIKLDNEEANFKVDGRYKIIIDIKDYLNNANNAISITAKLLIDTTDRVEEYVESGERLAMLSFYSGNKKISIGVEDELPDTLCTYDKGSVKFSVYPEAKVTEVIFGIAWITMDDYETQEIYTCFGADPTLYKAYQNIRKSNQEEL